MDGDDAPKAYPSDARGRNAQHDDDRELGQEGADNGFVARAKDPAHGGEEGPVSHGIELRTEGCAATEATRDEAVGGVSEAGEEHQRGDHRGAVSYGHEGRRQDDAQRGEDVREVLH